MDPRRDPCATGVAALAEENPAQLQFFRSRHVQFEKGHHFRRNGFSILLRLPAERLIEIVGDVLHVECCHCTLLG